MRNASRFLLESLKGRTRHSWEDNIEDHLMQKGWEGVDWIDVAQDRDR
jgi:hypothetical protein